MIVCQECGRTCEEDEIVRVVHEHVQDLPNDGFTVRRLVTLSAAVYCSLVCHVLGTVARAGLSGATMAAVKRDITPRIVPR